MLPFYLEDNRIQIHPEGTPCKETEKMATRRKGTEEVKPWPQTSNLRHGTCLRNKTLSPSALWLGFADCSVRDLEFGSQN